MAFNDLQLLDALSWMPFVESTELALILGEPHWTVHLPSSGRYFITASSFGEAARVLAFATPSDFVRAYRDVQGMADSAPPKDGRRGQRLPPGRHHRI